MTKSNDQLLKIKKKRDQLNARIQQMEAYEKTKARKRETKKKILIGAYYLDQAKKDDTYQDLVNQLDTFLVRSSDRQLFGLEDKKDNTKKQ